MAARNWIILLLTYAGGFSILYGAPPIYRPFVFGATLLVVAYIFAQMTKPRRPV